MLVILTAGASKGYGERKAETEGLKKRININIYVVLKILQKKELKRNTI